ncbi:MULTISPECIES: M23 family metallopeptidase [unclassified Microbacterium]|jgi:murein DD-endopeptidase MepM/ murein hydrolase activator NlpD|uniref:M23 family metallopeptidase n=1 Tax=Microbacterium sp. No. 7 TaxID=1714373 RepID=UPI0006ECDD5B|nr:M23 family metallopeptidase [Microbacterium sp. No. 7]ALJ20907.1 peptidase M23 [Microbacterium sp. No. 7]
MRKVLVFAVLGMLLAPMLGLLSVGVLMNPAVLHQAHCLASGLTLGPIPDELEVTTKDGTTFTLNKQQLTHAGTIITTGANTPGVGRDGILIALMAALTESTLRQLANTGTYPESGDFPNDGNGSDHDSLGLFQMRPQSGWGTVAELMDPKYQARAFYGGPDGPNYPSPRGLLDIPGWQQMDKGEAAQAVEVSAYPDRYQNYEPVARTILDALTRPSGGGGGGVPGDETIPETTRLVFPLPTGSYTRTSQFGPRVDPITGVASFHSGTDWATPDGTPIVALADGVVTYAGMLGGFSGQITIEHTIGGEKVATKYIHMWAHGIHVAAGDRVTAGQHIGDVGSSGHSTGPHLHFQVHPGGGAQPAVDAEPWLAGHEVEGADALTTGGGPGCAA